VSSSVAPDLSSLKSMADADVTHEQFGHWSALEREFLPPLLEIQESPPSPVHRWVLWNIIGLVAALIAWAIIGRISIVATAPGKFIPDGRVKEVQPLESSIVKAIHVTEGQRVHEGDVLLELDPTLSAAELAANPDKVRFNQLEQARLAAELSHTYGHVAVRSIGGLLDHLAAARGVLWLRANAWAAQEQRPL
jgi:multidrug efflux pump subunit AcrA (membrane-fusion protein)